MRAIDQNAIKQYGIPGIVLMENAGVEVVRLIEKVFDKVSDIKVCIFAGKGNNGGDGYVVARHLSNKGAKVKVFLLADKTEVIGDAKNNLDIISQMGIDVLEVAGDRDWDKMRIAVTFADCLVDGLVGTGFAGKLSGNLAQTVEIINHADKTVIAIDIPSGVQADTGAIAGLAVEATHTVTFGLPKPGLLLYPGATHTGEITVADIGIPTVLLSDEQIKQNLITVNDVRQALGRRRPDAHKGNCGKVLVVAGSLGLTGAAALAATAALRTGAGLVTLGIAESLHAIMEMKLTEVMTKPLPESVSGAIGKKALAYIEELAAQCDILAIGPGLGRQEETLAMVRDVIKQVDCPLILDADALIALVGYTDLLPDVKALPILTPHPGEFARMTGVSAEEINQDRIGSARAAAAQWGSIVVLKGARTVVAFPDGEVYINITGNAGMASGGTGDVLTGVIAALAAQGLSSHAAAIVGVYMHGLAGDIVAQNGLIGLTASDVIAALPAAICGVQEA
jgi:NAD(P)H-hydrate epimerase